MITYRGEFLSDAITAAAHDSDVWSEEERAALAELAEGLVNNAYNMALMADYVPGEKWDGTEESLRQPQAYSEPWGTGRIYCIRGSGYRFLCHEAGLGAWSVGLCAHQD